MKTVLLVMFSWLILLVLLGAFRPFGRVEVGDFTRIEPAE